MALVTLSALVVGVWAAGCTGLSNDCELNLTCPSSVAASTTTGTGVVACSGSFFGGSCDACLKKSCCKELGACDEDGACMFDCVFNVLPSPPECSASPTSTLLDSFGQCMSTNCATECTKDQCNAVTVSGCPDPTQFNCELVFGGMFVCFQLEFMPATQCQPCDNLYGPYCGSGLRCHASGTCARYCCSDADCGTGRCELDPMKAFGAPLANAADKVGVCVTMDGTTAACDAPAMSPSGGTCFGGFPPM
jgi:hypothetical protein